MGDADQAARRFPARTTLGRDRLSARWRSRGREAHAHAPCDIVSVAGHRWFPRTTCTASSFHDDGPGDLESSLALARGHMAARVRCVTATPPPTRTSSANRPPGLHEQLGAATVAELIHWNGLSGAHRTRGWTERAWASAK